MPITTALRAFEASYLDILRMPELDARRSISLDMITEPVREECDRK